MKLADKIRDRINGVQGELGIYFCDLKSNTSCFVGNCDVFPSLGIAKLVLLVEVFRQIEVGSLKLDDEYILKKEAPFAVPEEEYEVTVGILDFLHNGTRLTIEDLIYSMMVISDNSAFNILLSLIGLENVNETLSKLGLANTKMQCMLFEWDERKPEMDNYHSVKEIGSLLKRIYRGQLISVQASENMKKILSYHQRRDILSLYSNASISVAQQTGFDFNCLHTAAIVMTENPFVLCMSANKIDAKHAEGIMKDIAQMCGNETYK